MIRKNKTCTLRAILRATLVNLFKMQVQMIYYTAINDACEVLYKYSPLDLLVLKKWRRWEFLVSDLLKL